MTGSFERIWQAILAHEGETFYTLGRRLEFTYQVFPDEIVCSRAKTWRLTKSNFEKAYECIDTVTATEFSKTIMGSSYVKAILKDSRIY